MSFKVALQEPDELKAYFGRFLIST